MLIDRTWLAGGFGPAWDDLRHWFARTPAPVFPVAGQDLLALGMRPGPEMGRMLSRLRGWWLEGGCLAGKAACLEEAIRNLAEPGDPPPASVA